MKFLYNPFIKKKEKEKLKELPLPEATKSVSKKLSLYSVSLQYNVRYSSGHKFSANISYKENPKDYSNPGIVEELELLADSWPELVEKVSDHFECKENA